MRTLMHSPTSVRAAEHGFSLIELLISTLILTVVGGTAIKGLIDMSRISDMVSNRSDMHAGVRNATELLAQEVGQAGRVSLPAPVTLDAAAAIGSMNIIVSSTDGMFVGEQLTIDAGDQQETVEVAAINGNTITVASALVRNHPAAGVPVQVLGGFSAGIVPDDMANGSTDFVLKVFGDVLGNGNMVYVEYTCDLATGRLYRNMMDFDAVAKSPATIDEVLIDNILPNPDQMPCFRYQTRVVAGVTYVLDVAITLTVRSQQRDQTTGDFHQESKALLNVAPRNVFNVWQLAGMAVTNRIQPMPPSVALLLED